MLGRKDVDGVAAHPEMTAHKLGVVALVLHANQLGDEVSLREFVTHTHGQDHGVVIRRVANAIDARDRGHNDGVAAFEQRFRG